MDFPENFSPEKLEQMKALFEQMSNGLGPPDSSIKALCESHSEQTECLGTIEIASAVRMISCLETFPDLNENTIRIEVLLHLAVCCCKGSKEATPADLRHWVSLMDSSPMASQEDPSEDIFVGYVCTERGGFRVYPGMFSNADFILERLVHFLAEKTNAPGFGNACDAVIELLRLSDAIRYIGPIRRIPERNFQALRSPDEDRWADGSGAWDLICTENANHDWLPWGSG